MNGPGSNQELQEQLDRIGAAADGDDRVSLEEILAAMESISFGALLLVAGLVTIVPIVGDIPGVPTTMGVLVVLGSAQLLLGRESLWLPRWLRERAVRGSAVTKVIDRTRPVARTVDRVLKPRLGVFVRGAATYVIAVVTLLVGAVMPVMEFIPFSANLAGVVLTIFGLALMARDGLLALIGLALIMTAVGLIALRLFA